MRLRDLGKRRWSTNTVATLLIALLIALLLNATGVWAQVERIVLQPGESVTIEAARPSSAPPPVPNPSPTLPPSPSPSPSPPAPSPSPLPPTNRVFSGNVSLPSGFTVPAGQTWSFDPNVDTTVTVQANVIVNGVLQMRPANAGVEHLLRFTGIDETKVVGGGMDPVATDVGLWVMGAGQLDIQGTTRTAWNRTGTDPTWLPGDEIRVAPTAAGDFGASGFATFVPGSTVPTAFGYSAEVINLTRNVRIEGTPTGRTHVFIRSTKPQTIRYAAFRYVGPRKNDAVIPGRWGLHFHFSGNGSRGSIVEGVVIRDAGSHVFVPHASNGVVYRNDIAYDVMGDAYWWDDNKFESQHDSHEIVWENSLACIVRPEVRTDVTLTGFNMGRGTGNVARGNVAVGVLGTYDSSSGFKWGEHGSGLWVFENNVAHNNRISGIFNWFNNGQPHTFANFVAYRNGQYGINHGAYHNNAKFIGGRLVGNGYGGVRLQAASRGDAGLAPLTFRGYTIEGGLFLSHHALPSAVPVLFIDSPITGTVRIDDKFQEPTVVDFVRTGLEPGNFQVIQMQPDSRIRVERANGTAFQITSAGVTTISAFAPAA